MKVIKTIKSGNKQKNNTISPEFKQWLEDTKKKYGPAFHQLANIKNETPVELNSMVNWFKEHSKKVKKT